MANTTLRNAARDLSDRAGSARDGYEQNMWLLGAGVGGLVLGLLLYALLGGPIARLAPVPGNGPSVWRRGCWTNPH